MSAENAKLILRIPNCSFCPYVRITGENVQEWKCGKAAEDRLSKKLGLTGRYLARVEYPSEIPEIPDWCPCRPENEVKTVLKPEKTKTTESGYYGYFVFYVELTFDNGMTATCKHDGDFTRPDGMLSLMANLGLLLAGFYEKNFGIKLKSWRYLTKEEYEAAGGETDTLSLSYTSDGFVVTPISDKKGEPDEQT